jgi:protein-disulfide isomerase
MKIEKLTEKFIWILIVTGLFIAIISAFESHWGWLANLCGSFGSGCREVRSFTFLSLPIAYWGIAFYLILALTNRFTKTWMFWMVMPAIGIEITFVWIMYSLDIPCLFCLLNALVMILLLISFFQKQLIWQSISLCLVGLLASNYVLLQENRQVIPAVYDHEENTLKSDQNIKKADITKKENPPTITKTASKETTKTAKTSSNTATETADEALGQVADIDINNNPSFGPKDAKVTIIEFSDYMCPACRRLHSVNSKIRKEYQDKVKWVFKDFPLQQHQGSDRLAEAARCAWEQNKFWEFQDELFKADLSTIPGIFPTIIQNLNMDLSQFIKCFESRKYMFEVIKDRQDALNADVNATPTLFINGRKIAHLRSEEDFIKIIEDELNRYKG